MSLLLSFLALSFLAYRFGRSRILLLVSFDLFKLRSRPHHHGVHVALWGIFWGLGAFLLWGLLAHYGFLLFLKHRMTLSSIPVTPIQIAQVLLLIKREILGSPWVANTPALEKIVRELAPIKQALSFWSTGVGILFFLFGMGLNLYRLDPQRNTAVAVEKILVFIMLLCTTIAFLVTVGIIVSLLTETFRFFQTQSFFGFLFGTHWAPQSGNSFGAVPLFLGTFLITFIALIVAAPIGLMSAIYTAEYATSSQRAFIKPLLEVLAGIPTVVYGFFAALAVAPFIRFVAHAMGFSASSESALAAGLVMGIMIIPFISSLSDDVLRALPSSLRGGAMALGATKRETILKVLIPAALPGIMGGLLLSASRAIGETMIVVMAAGLQAKMTLNPLESVTTVTAQIVMLLNGDQAFDSPKTLSAFALGMVLFCFTFFMNWVAMRIVRTYRERY